MIIHLVNQIIVERLILVAWEFSTVVNCFKGKGDASERTNYRGMKLADQILKITEKVIENMIRQ